MSTKIDPNILRREAILLVANRQEPSAPPEPSVLLEIAREVLEERLGAFAATLNEKLRLVTNQLTEKVAAGGPGSHHINLPGPTVENKTSVSVDTEPIANAFQAALDRMTDAPRVEVQVDMTPVARALSSALEAIGSQLLEMTKLLQLLTVQTPPTINLPEMRPTVEVNVPPMPEMPEPPIPLKREIVFKRDREGNIVSAKEV